MTPPSLFTEFGTDLLDLAAQKNQASPLRDNPHIPLLIDTLSRYERHHVACVSQLSEHLHLEFMKAIAEHIQDENVPNSLRHCRLIYFDTLRFQANEPTREKIEHDIEALCAQLKDNHQRRILAISQTDFLTMNAPGAVATCLQALIRQILVDEHWRVIVFVSNELQVKKLPLSPKFSVISLKEPGTTDLIELLKRVRPQLENFHKASISDEIIVNALTMAGHYLPGHTGFDKTLALLDSAAAETGMLDRHTPGEQKSTVTPHFLAQVISHQTGIPLTHLQGNIFQVSRLAEALKKQIFGQDAAINLMASLLQNACIKLQDKQGPLCSFLLAGPEESGKTTLAHAMAEHLWGHREALLRVNLNKTASRFFPEPDQSPETHWLLALQRMPYAILLLETIDELPPESLQLIDEIMDQGYLVDNAGNRYDFRHAILIATTRLTCRSMHHETPSASVKDPKALDLMQLVLNEHVLDPLQQNHAHLSPETLREEVFPELIKKIPQKTVQQFNIIPFIAPDYAALEKIVRSKIKAFAKQLHNTIGIEFSFAPEVIKFLAHEALWRKNHTRSLDQLLEQRLYSLVTHTILAHADDRDRSKRLLVRLDESGQLLQCEFITTHEAAFY